MSDKYIKKPAQLWFSFGALHIDRPHHKEEILKNRYSDITPSSKRRLSRLFKDTKWSMETLCEYFESGYGYDEEETDFFNFPADPKDKPAYHKWMKINLLDGLRVKSS